MSVVAEIDLEPDRLILAETLEAVPGVKLALEREFSTGSPTPVVFMWATGTTDDLDAFERAIQDDETVTDVERLTGGGKQRLYRMYLTGEAPVTTAPAWLELGAARLAARFADGHWRFRMRFPDREALREFRAFCEEEELGFRLRRLCEADDPDRMLTDGLTDRQREALRLANERGYFDLPRTTSLEELAEELGISDQAVSERLRRGCARLIGQHVE